MSILDFPRLHFQGVARTYLPNDCGRFSCNKQGHFSIETKIVSVQKEFGKIEQDDPIIGCKVDFGGLNSENQQIKNICNSALIFESDPASNWTNTIMVDRLVLGGSDDSTWSDSMLSAPVRGLSLARWQDFYHIRELPENCLNDKFGSAAVYQFAVSKDAKNLLWNDEEVSLSPTASVLREAMKQDNVLGLVVQFSLSGISAPVQAYASDFWELHGTIGLWYEDELATYPHGRLLTPQNSSKSLSRESQPLGNLTLKFTPEGASLNMVTAVPCVARSSQLADDDKEIFFKIDIGNLELRTIEDFRLIAKIPYQAYQKQAHELTSGIVDIPYCEDWADFWDEVEDQGLCIVGTVNEQRQILAEEKEINIQVDDACLFLENSIVNDSGQFIDLEIRSFVRGRPQAVEVVYLNQFYNPDAFPQLREEFEWDTRNKDRIFNFPHSSEMPIIGFKPGKASEKGYFGASCEISTNQQGRAWVTLRGAIPGTAKILISTFPYQHPCYPNYSNEAEMAYDNQDKLGFWNNTGFFVVRAGN